jgi:hypothetical protein
MLLIVDAQTTLDYWLRRRGVASTQARIGGDMGLSAGELAKLEAVKPYLLTKIEAEIVAAIDSGSVLDDVKLRLYRDNQFGSFYAPFGWINEKADIVIIGITPGKSQAKAALIELRRSLAAGHTLFEAAARAKQEASFKGEMREIGTMLMDHFRLHQVFGLSRSDELFGQAADRAHYTSVLRYPVLERKIDKKRKGTEVWANYGGSDKIMTMPFMARMIEENLVPELRQFSNAWLLPFGPVPAHVLDALVRRKVVDGARVLAGINHPSGTQWNRHNCQLNATDDHSGCGRNVGCEKIRARSAALHQKVSEILGLQ